MSFKLLVVLGWLSRGAGMFLALLNARLLLEIIGAKGFAAHAVVTSFTTWLALLNLGIPGSVQNLISRWRVEKRALDGLYRTIGSLFLVCLVVLSPLVFAGALLVKKLLLGSYPFVSSWALGVAFECLFIAGLGNIFMSMLYAEHRSIWPNTFPAAAVGMVSLLLLICRRYSLGDFNLVLSLYFVPNVIFVVLAYLLLRLRPGFQLDRRLLREILEDGRGFLVVAFLGTLTLGVDYMILSRLLSARDMVAYNMASKVFLVIQTMYAVVLSSTWTPISDLYFSGRKRAVRWRAFGLGFAGAGMALLWSLVVIAASSLIFGLLTAGRSITLPLGFMILWGGLLAVRMWSDSFYTVLQSIGETRDLRRYLVCQAFVSVALQWGLGERFGMTGVVLAIMLSFVLTCVWYLPWRAIVMTRTARGISG